METVVAVVLLGMVAATVSSAVAFLEATQSRQRQRLGAAELANRLVLMFVDDEDEMPSPARPLDYGVDQYRWKMNSGRVELNINPAGRSEESERRGFRRNRIKQVTITVWLGEESGGSFQHGPNVPQATLTRLIDPLAIRNPDSIRRRFETEAEIQRFIMDLMDIPDGS